MPVVAVQVPTNASFPSGSEVVRIQYELGRLEIHVRAMRDKHEATVSFACVEAFRVMDERDLMDFWPTCSTPNGWLFEVATGGWLSQEAERPGSLVAHTIQGVREFLITGEDDCVSVLSVELPVVIIKE